MTDRERQRRGEQSEASAASPDQYSRHAASTPTLLRYADLVARNIVNNRQTLANWIRLQGFPPGIKLSPQARAWTDSSVAEWLAGRPTRSKKPEDASV
jgi:predicted DNA-binding transcriptional regulator AlpA